MMRPVKIGLEFSVGHKGKTLLRYPPLELDEAAYHSTPARHKKRYQVREILAHELPFLPVAPKREPKFKHFIHLLHHDLDEAYRFLDANPDLEHDDYPEKINALLSCIQHGNREALLELLDLGFDPTQVGEHRMNCAHWAACLPSMAVFNLCHKACGSSMQPNEYGLSVQDLAVLNNQERYQWHLKDHEPYSGVEQVYARVQEQLTQELQGYLTDLASS